MRIETNMSTLKTQDMAADRARDARVQSLNPAAMEQEEDKVRDDELHRTQAVEEAEYARIEENKREPEHPQKRGGAPRGQDEEAPPEPDDETMLLQQEAAERLLNLPVDVGKFADREQRRIDLLL